jgi:hypothetical protein
MDHHYMDRQKARTVREALVDRTWIPDIVGAPSG